MADVDGNAELNEIVVSAEKSTCCKNGTLSNGKYVLQKKEVFKLKKSDKDIYVNNKTPLKGFLYKCEKLFDRGASELVIHGLGAAVYRAARLALQLKEIHHGTLDLDIRTSTIALVDELESLSDDVDNKINNRQNSAIHIRVIRRVPVAVLRSK
ncbi:ribonuclease P protein subunit p20-like isoform X1 [Pogonomyrmex barbatus]|uniref:Ribonuclease P protein subunit p20 n=1 Tax=Pogonomyrmex barbatus TaxID=144034 RepID=A0A8N1S8H3_9HYME|nr:ribonuclease P protein subunit p20-like isoform X1 [Pogonomyrmex barbatus]